MTPVTPAAPAKKPATPATPPKTQTPLDRLYGRLKTAREYLTRAREEAVIFAAREDPGSAVQIHLNALVKGASGVDRIAEGIKAIESLQRLGWAPKGAAVLSKFKVGDAVRITEKRRVDFTRHALYDAAAVSGPAKVVKVSGGHVAIKLDATGEVLSPVIIGWLELVKA